MPKLAIGLKSQFHPLGVDKMEEQKRVRNFRLGYVYKFLSLKDIYNERSEIKQYANKVVRVTKTEECSHYDINYHSLACCRACGGYNLTLVDIITKEGILQRRDGCFGTTGSKTFPLILNFLPQTFNRPQHVVRSFRGR